jgi:DNA polymerase-3 subunit alpha
LEALVRSGAVDCLGAERAVLWEVIPDALKAADQSAKNQDAGMFDLFGEVEAESDACSYEDYKNVRPWTDKERLAGEKDTLGLYLTGHPIDEYESELKHFISKRIVELQPARGQSQKMAGLVVDLRLKKTKKGENLCFVTLDDRSARIDVTLFGDTYDAVRNIVVKDAVLVVEGEVAEDHYSGGLKVRVSKVLSIPQARAQYASGVQVVCDSSQLGQRSLKELETLLHAHEGDGSLPVKLRYQRSDAAATIVLGEQWQVQANDELLIALMEKFGHESVSLTY